MGVASFLLALLAGGLAMLVPADGNATFDKNRRRQVMRSVVYLMAADRQGGDVVPVSSGSGTILTPDGAILTNYHVIFNEKEGRAHDLVAVGLLKSFDEEPELTCIAQAKNALTKPELDLAIVKCETDMQGRPFAVSNWPTLPVGSSEDLVPGDDVVVLGYPGIGGSTIHVTAGKVSGFQGERGGAGRAYIKTDAAITHGNSGGTALDEEGKFIGVPSAFRVTTEASGETSGNVGLIRPIELARELVSQSRGWRPGDPSTGVGSLGLSGAVKKETGGVTVIGRVLDSDNHEPVAGAIVVIFKPGVRVRELTKDNVGEKYLSKGITNARGEFVLERPVPRGGRYTVLVYASDYSPLAADDVLSTEGSESAIPERYEPWGPIELERD